MNDLLINLRKAIDRALDIRGETQEILLSEFPSHVIKSLEVILSDPDEARASNRLMLLKAKVDEAARLTKQSVGSFEDIESQKIQVPIFEETGLTAKPTEEGEQALSATGGALGSSAVQQGNGSLNKALDALRQEMASLKQAFHQSLKAKSPKPEDEEFENDKNTEKKTKPKKPGEEEAPTEEKQKAKKPEEDKKADEEDSDKKVSKSDQTSWPLDMNETMPDAKPVSKRNPDRDWGSDLSSELPKSQTA
jgi:hypothetical protein